MDYQGILQEIADEIAPLRFAGKQADYIPALAEVPLGLFGMAVATVDGDFYTVGDAYQRFSIQSISKLFALTLALHRLSDSLWERVGREPSGTPFNSLVQLENEQGIPRNPFVNAGALVITDVLCRRFVQPELAVLQFLRRLTSSEAFDVDQIVARSERANSDRNAAIAHFMKSFGNLDGQVSTVLDAYCQQCAIAMSCAELAHAACFLAADGEQPGIGRVLTPQEARRINAVMLTCGTYDAAGEFAFRIGLPAKSGVGGGILAIVPGRLSICAWSPGLDATGNSVAAAAALERFAARTGLTVFAPHA